MAKLTSVTRDEQIDDFVAAQVSDGHYASPSAVIDAGLKLPRDQAEIAAIRSLSILMLSSKESGRRDLSHQATDLFAQGGRRSR